MLKRTKGFVSLAAAIALMLGLCSCSGKSETDPSTTADPTGIGAQAETGENNTAKDIAPESGAPETAAEEANTAKEAGTTAQTEKTTKKTDASNANVSAAGFIWPVPGYTQLSSPYSTQYKRISIKADFGAKVVACATGKITKIYNKDDESKTPCAVLTCANGYVIEYSAANLSVKVGDVVARGDSIGFIGRYGTGPHLNISATKDGASIVIDKLTKSFKGKTVLEDVNMRLQEGRIYGIVGDNGSGKTVLLKLICGFMKPDSGTVTVNGKVIGKDADFPENTGIIIEAPGFLPNYSGMKNLEYLASIRGKIGKEQIESAMKTVGLDPSSKLRVGKYSLGMKQRLGIAQAIMEDQQLLILDEPMNALDKDAVEEMRKLFLSFKASGKTMLIVSHNEGDISTLCDEVYEFDGARIKRRENV